MVETTFSIKLEISCKSFLNLSEVLIIEKPQIGQFTSNLMQTLHETVGDFASIGLIDTQAMHTFDVLGLSLPQIKGQEHG